MVRINSKIQTKSSNPNKPIEALPQHTLDVIERRDDLAASSAVDKPVDLRGVAVTQDMTKHERKEATAGERVPGAWNLATPQAGLEKLIPSLIVADEIQLQKEKYYSSADLANFLRQAGDTVETYPFRHYRESVYVGQTRLFSNADCIKGKEPIYGNLDNAMRVWKDEKSFLKDVIIPTCEADNSLWARCCLEDAPKVSMQQWTYPGWYLENLVTEVKVPRMSDHHYAVCKKITRRYKQCLPRDLDTNDFRALALLDYDPDDTMTGSPTFASGEQTPYARLDTLRAYPVPIPDVKEWYARLLSLQATMGWQDPTLYSPVVSKRFGPRAKPIRLFTGSDGFLESTMSAVGAFNRVRKVYPAPYPINYLWSPLYKQLSGVRRCIPGLWHDPERQDEYIRILQKQGKYPYSVDFTGMDTGMWPDIIIMMATCLLGAGFCQWPLQMMLELYPHMGIIYPTLEGGVNNISMITGPVRPWCSGWKLTSEFDTLYGLCVILDSLDQTVCPGILDAWCNGSWTLAELGDDIIFTLASRKDMSEVQAYAEKVWGATLKVNEDLMFLKWMLPLNGEVTRKARTFARVLQQTLHNEDKYSGIQGGTRPNEVLRVALKSRCLGLDAHPKYKQWMPSLIDILVQLPFVKEAGSEYIDQVILGDKLALDSDMTAMLQYAKAAPSYFLSIQERSKYEPSAALMLDMWQRLGIPIDNTPALEMRKLYDQALFTEPTAQDIARLMDRWTNAAIM